MDYVKATPVNLKNHPKFSEKWLQERIAEDPALLGLGELEVKDLERRQPRAGRLDLLLVDPEAHTRYEVEIQLGATDETHIVRTVEYWDLERNRYPQYDHVAVLIAEDITSRFLNVISLFNKAIPLVAIQIRALEVGTDLTLHATTVLDLMPLGTEEEDEPGQSTDRNYWLKKGSKKTVETADDLLDLINEVTGDSLALKYNKFYIGLSREGLADNFAQFRPRKDNLVAEFRVTKTDALSEKIDNSGLDTLDYDKKWGRYRFRITHEEIAVHRDLLVELITNASGTSAPTSDG